ncbi:hypothetical protein LZC95_32390 [Pendulispora brunnea]|uniref:Glycosyl hydrolase family 13 catalytic domain-containing protein n=1 Tax=Pendulispora brunnea TaxID=2905690 RepID=A0ABZ2JXC4_9BACT
MPTRKIVSLGLLAASFGAFDCAPSDTTLPHNQREIDAAAPNGDGGAGASDALPSVRTGHHDVFYFVLPDRFANGSTANDTGGIPGQALDHGYLPSDKGYYHGGDLAGVISKLDYIKGLGTTAIWMGPIFKNRAVQGNGTIAGSSSGYHGYWTIDYTQVDPHFGTNEDLKRLVQGARERGIKVYFDIIVNHTADVISYRENKYGYRSKTAYPYRDAQGRPFDDRDYAGGSTFPQLSADKSFAYGPVFGKPADATVKVPAWLNDPTMYHNRGDSTFTGEDSLYGDFFGLDDLFTERPEVVRGMIDIHKKWIHDVGIDGFRIDTARHVNDEFWQQFLPEVLNYARAEGKKDFFMFGEVSEPKTAEALSHFTSVAKFQAVLDFAFQKAAREFASNPNGTSDGLGEFFASDDYYIDADSNAYAAPTFLGNHDMGRFGYFLKTDNPAAKDDELVQRDKLGHALMFFARGMPIVYYGDEQGFTGDGGDKDARETMFASKVASYNDNKLIGTTSTTAKDNYEPAHPLYQGFHTLAALRNAHPALHRGAQIHRASSAGAGIYAFSRIDRTEQIEYVVALNNAKEAKSVSFPVYTANGFFRSIYPTALESAASNKDKVLTVKVPAFGAVVLRADAKLPARTAAPAIVFVTPTAESKIRGRKEFRVDLDQDTFAEVTFAVRKSDTEAWTPIGTDDNAPYRVFYDTSSLAAGTRLRIKATVRDHSGNVASTETVAVVGGS